jgi:cytochrome P450
LNSLPLALQEKDDLLSRFVKLSTQGDSRFDDRALRDIMINFILAGRDSTASVLSWFIYMLYRHPHVTAKVRDELSALQNRCSTPGIPLLAGSNIMM